MNKSLLIRVHIYWHDLKKYFLRLETSSLQFDTLIMTEKHINWSRGVPKLSGLLEEFTSANQIN